MAIRPTLTTVAELQKKIADQELVTRKFDSKITQLVTAQRDLARFASGLPNFDPAVPDNHNQGSLAKRFELLAQENGLSVNNFSFSAVPLLGPDINLTDKKGSSKPPVEFGGKIALFEVSFDLSGEPNHIFDYLAGMENMDRIAIISDVDFKIETTGKNLNGPGGGVRAAGKARGYYVFGGKL